jgi:2'-5' RNA ligase
MIKTRGENGKLKLEFAGLDVFGTPENTRVIFMKLKENGP